jgi:hypothetical protein
MTNDIEEIILDSLKELIELKCIKDPITEIKSKLVYPIKRDKTRRVSEQEIRFLFIKNIENKSDYLYSVEVPTSKEYFFTGKEKNKRSGNFDVCLYGKDRERKHLIEFKALNPKNASYHKDFEKLIKDEDGLTNYFIQVIINSDYGTITCIEKKYNEGIQNAISSNLNNRNKSKLVIFLCEIGKNKRIFRYEIFDKNLSNKNQIYPIVK